MKGKWLKGFMVLAMVMISGCAKNSPLAPEQTPDTGQVIFSVQAVNVASGLITITKTPLVEQRTVAIANNTGQAVFNGLEVGRWSVLVELFNEQGAKIYEGTGQADVTTNNTTQLTIRVSELTGNLVINVEVPQELVVFNSTQGIEVINSDSKGRRVISSRADLTITSNNYRGGRVLLCQTGTGESLAEKIDLDGNYLGPINITGKGFRWNWDGTKIAYLHNGSLYVCNADGTGETLFENGYTVSSFCWTNENKIVYTDNSPAPANQAKISIAEMDGTFIREILLDKGTNGILFSGVKVADCSGDGMIIFNCVDNLYYRTLHQVNIFGAFLETVHPGSYLAGPTTASYSRSSERIVSFSDVRSSAPMIETYSREGGNYAVLINTSGDATQPTNPWFVY